MKKKEIITELSKNFLNELGMTFQCEEKGSSMKSSSEGFVDYSSVIFSIKNKIDHRFAKSLRAEFISYTNKPGIYLDVCWYQPPACRMICSTDQVATLLSDLKENKDKIKSAIEYAIKLADSHFSKN